jgi:DNA-binding response OmpR family regulator
METINSHVLMIDDDPTERGVVREYLSQNDFRVTAVSSGKQVMEILGQEAIDLLLLDVRLPDENGMHLAHTVRQNSKVPIVMLSGRADEADRIMGLELGADDYVTKPCSPRELLARIRALLRRAQMQVSPSRDATVRSYRFAGWELNVRLHRLRSPRGEKVEISRREFDLLIAFLSMPQQILTRDQLLELSRLHSTEVYDRCVDVQIMRLRRKIEADATRPQLIRTERGVGYFFDASVQVVR